jgi:hypothetical protein
MLSINGATQRGQVAFGGYFKNNMQVTRQRQRRDGQQIPVGHG